MSTLLSASYFFPPFPLALSTPLFLSSFASFITSRVLLQIIVDHVVLRCVTGPQAGNHLYWTVNVAGAISEVPYTSTRPPNVTSAVVLFTGDGLGTDVNGNETGAVPLQNASALFSNSSFHGAARSADGVSLSTSGGGVVVLTGTYVRVVHAASRVIPPAPPSLLSLRLSVLLFTSTVLACPPLPLLRLSCDFSESSLAP